MTQPVPIASPLLAEVRQLIDAARQRVASVVNAELTQLYWHIGRSISAELLQGQRGEYGKQVVVELARQLTADFGKGWSERQLRYCVRVAEVFPAAEILHTLCSQLSWSHLRLVIQIDDTLKRDFYLEICRVERWSVRQLQERINSLLFERTAISKKPEETIRQDLNLLRNQGQLSPDLTFRDPSASSCVPARVKSTSNCCSYPRAIFGWRNTSPCFRRAKSCRPSCTSPSNLPG